LFLFVIGHLAGNLLLFVGADAFNAYAHKLISLGVLLYVIEAILVTAFLVHMVTAISVTWNNWKARPDRYKVSAGQGEPSRMTISSKTMIWTGLVLLVFLVVHLITFKYGPGIEQGYVVELDGEPVRDLYRLVVESYGQVGYTAFYVVCMALLGFHVRHGFWSAIQSLGGFHPKLTPVAYSLGLFAAAVLAAGFIVIPVWFYFAGGVTQ
jgi:succinate dehydrogenase / fumarate reductase cytochrome b subunit